MKLKEIIEHNEKIEKDIIKYPSITLSDKEVRGANYVWIKFGKDNTLSIPRCNLSIEDAIKLKDFLNKYL